ncbi:hypothetical protein HG531_014009 [Fusarium graminearum]|nr:hypothetical protein HG531_014009 [Fusarium graminearum]
MQEDAVPPSHAVFESTLGGAVGILGLELVGNLDVKITSVLVVGSDIKVERDLLTLLDGEDVLKVEDGLLPGVDEVVALSRQLEGHLESQVGDGAGVEIEGKDRSGVGDSSLDLDSVDKGLRESSGLEGGVVETSNLSQKILTLNLVLLVVAILNTGKEDGGLVREDQTILLEVGVTSVENGVKHGLVEKEVSHPLGDDNVDLGEGKLNLLHLALEKGDLVRKAVDLDDLTGLENDGGHIDTDNMLSTGLSGKPSTINPFTNHLPSRPVFFSRGNPKTPWRQYMHSNFEQTNPPQHHAWTLLSVLYQKNTVDAALVLWVIGDLSVATPNNLSTSGDQTKFADVDLDDGTLCQDTELSLNGNAKLGVCDVGLLVTETHGADEALVLGVASSEVGSDKGGLGDHALPGLLLDLLSGLDNLEHLLLADTADLGQGDGKLGSLLGSLVLDSTAESLGS